jgi:N-acetylneuraminate lyase
MHGTDETLLCALALGITSAIGSTYNFAAPLYNRIIEAYNNGVMATAQEEQLLSVRFVLAMAGTGDFFSACKHVMQWLGMDLGGVRPPLKNLDPAVAESLKRQMDELDFFQRAT